MFIRPITKLKFQSFMPATDKKQASIAPTVSTSPSFAPSFFGESKVYSDQIQALKLDMKEFPEDIKYRKQLMINAGKNPDEFYKLRSIIGLDEIKSIMSEFNENEDVYSVGFEDENIKNKTIRANWHTHTLASDGYMSAQELLDKAAAYADEAARVAKQKKEPFTIAITDHDTAESAKEAIEIISNNPLKYKNLRVVLGTEFTTYNNIATHITNKPTSTHILVYGIDPNEQTFDEFIESTKLKKREISQKMINQANKTYREAFNEKGDFFSLKEAKEFYNPLKKDILGIFIYMQKFIDTKLMLDEVVLKDPILLGKLQQKELPLYGYGLTGEMRDFFTQVDKTNKSRFAEESIPMFLSDKLDMSEDEIKEILKNAPQSDEYKKFKQNIKTDLNEYKRTITPKYDYMPTIKSLYEMLKVQPHTIIGIAHPLETIAEIKDTPKRYEFLTDLYAQFKHQAREKAGFSEVYYQSYTEPLNDFKLKAGTKELLEKLSEGLFKTGSADSHRTNIFKRLF